MTQDTFVPPTLTMGIDLGDRFARFCCLDEAGKEVEAGRIAMDREAFRRKFEAFPRARIALEAGAQSQWVYEVLVGCGHEVLVANPRQLPSISGNERKTDAFDAEQLARLARVDPQLLRPVQPRSRAVQVDRAVLVARRALVKARTGLVNACRGLLKLHGVRIRPCSTAAFAKVAGSAVPEDLRPALLPLLIQLAHLTAQIRDFDRKIAELGKTRYPETQVLQQVKGVGSQVALAFVLTLEDPKRFRRSRSVGAFLGLTPRRNQSGNRDPELAITKAGDPLMRTLLVQSAQYILGPRGADCDLRRFGERIQNRGKKNAKKRAVVAVARKLAVVLHALWKTASDYQPLRPPTRRRSPPRAPALALH